MENMRRIYLVRHGALYEERGIHRCLGHTDVPLSDRGKRQAQKIGEWFRDKNIERIYCSPLERCVTTAQIIKKLLWSQGRDVEIKALEALQEMDAGEWDNLSFSEIRKQYSVEYEERGRNLGYYAPPGGESFFQAGIRFGRCLDGIRRETGGNILVVAHAGVMRGYLSDLLGVCPNHVFSIPQPYAGITILLETDTKIKIETIGWRPYGFLDQEEIRYLYGKCNTPERTVRHMEAVAGYMEVLKEQLGFLGFDWNLLKKAALVHDICRMEKEHAKAGAEVLRKEGYEEVAELVERHHSADGVAEGMSAVSEEELLFYADKRVQEDKIVSVETRFKCSLEKCKTPEAEKKHQRLYKKTKYIETKIAHLIGEKVK